MTPGPCTRVTTFRPRQGETKLSGVRQGEVGKSAGWGEIGRSVAGRDRARWRGWGGNEAQRGGVVCGRGEAGRGGWGAWV